MCSSLPVDIRGRGDVLVLEEVTYITQEEEGSARLGPQVPFMGYPPVFSSAFAEMLRGGLNHMGIYSLVNSSLHSS